MSEVKKRKVPSPDLKAKIGLEAIRGLKTLNEIAQEYGVHPVQVGQYKKQILSQAGELFEGKRGPKPVNEHAEPERLYSEIGKLKMELDWLKKVRCVPVIARMAWVAPEKDMAVSQQCELAGVSRATVYAQRKPQFVCVVELLLCRLIDEEYTRRPFYGSRKMVCFLLTQGHVVNRKRVQRMMREMGLAGMAPGPNTSKAHPENKVYPYLLRGVPIVRPNQVWSTDITYIRLAHGFAYLVAVIDWYSRKVLSWRISNSMDASFCVDCLEDALRSHGTPEAFTGVLKREGVTISMDGRGRAFDNIFVERLWRTVKYEDVYLNGYANMGELMLGLTEYMMFYNEERFHQALGNDTPSKVYQTGSGGGAMILEKYGSADEAQTPTPTMAAKTGQRRAAACEISTA